MSHFHGGVCVCVMCVRPLTISSYTMRVSYNGIWSSQTLYHPVNHKLYVW